MTLNTLRETWGTISWSNVTRFKWTVRWWDLPLDIILSNFSSQTELRTGEVWPWMLYFFSLLSGSSNSHLFSIIRSLILLLAFQLLSPPSLQSFIREPVSIQTNLMKKHQKRKNISHFVISAWVEHCLIQFSNFKNLSSPK